MTLNHDGHQDSVAGGSPHRARLWGRGIGSKLVRSLVLLIVAIGGLVTWAVARTEIENVETDLARLEEHVSGLLETKAKELTRAHAEAITILAADNAVTDIQRLIARTVAEDEDVVFGAYLTADGIAWAYSGPQKENVGDSLDPNVASAFALSPATRAGQRRVEHAGEPVSEYWVPISDSEGVIGSLHYGLSAKRLTNQLEQARASRLDDLEQTLVQLLALTIGAVLLTAWIARRIALSVVGPVTRLTVAAADLAQGRSHVPVAIRSGDELETLGNTFNQMVEQLGDSYQKLEASHAQLVAEGQERERAESERAELERKFLRAQKLEAMGRLAGGVAHDFNNVLTAVQGNLELMRLSPLPPSAEPLADAVTRAVAHGANLTRQLLTFSRDHADEPRVIDPATVVKNLHRMVGRLIETQLKLDVSIGNDVPHVCIDPGRLEQVLMNLAVNARDAVRDCEKGSIRIAVQRSTIAEARSTQTGVMPPGEYLQIVVEDNGVGIEPELVDRIFEPFLTTKGNEGTGLGLATVHGIVTQARGFIEVDSAPGKGTRFEVYLPRATPEAEEVPSPEPSVLPTPGKGKSIALCEDTAAVRAVTQRQLESHGYRVVSRGVGAELLAYYDEHEDAAPDLLLTDVMMPGLSGKELADAMQKRFPGLPVLFVSGYTQGVLEERGLKTAKESLLRKPFSLGILLERVGQLIEAAPSSEKASLEKRQGVGS